MAEKLKHQYKDKMTVRFLKKEIHVFYGITHNPDGPKLHWRIQHVTFKQICARGGSAALSDVWHERGCPISL